MNDFMFETEFRIQIQSFASLKRMKYFLRTDSRDQFCSIIRMTVILGENITILRVGVFLNALTK